MKKAVNIICYIINLYIYYIILCSFVSWIPNLNVNSLPIMIMYTTAGFYWPLLIKAPILVPFSGLINIIMLISVRKLLKKLTKQDDEFFGVVLTNNYNKDEEEKSDDR